MPTTLLFSHPRIFRPSSGTGFIVTYLSFHNFFFQYHFQRNFQSCLDPQKQARGYKPGEIFALLTLMEMSMISPQHILKITTMSLLAVKQPLLLIRNYYFVEAPLQGNLLRGIDNKTVRRQGIFKLITYVSGTGAAPAIFKIKPLSTRNVLTFYCQAGVSTRNGKIILTLSTRNILSAKQAPIMFTNIYRTRAIISRGLMYLFYSIFHWGLYSRAVNLADNLCTNQEKSSKKIYE